ncbi:GGDEF domain-containing response regulator [Pseudodesulfovibrio sediminis]|uniref:diguanylate cyclase n=1 Tax=Pseudodesulfovibrio sediminis TaxID=2810563 RepID=A0ABM7P8Y3_9BACT|nr:diguanylate cyclase [Pseudodesulfovibrio sediminis]BCS89491.1 diguanylate cyclase response regulator [Pseudodesulfovibrio sediminis]
MGIAKILIVDDKPENLLTLESLLDYPDLELVRADSGAEALAQILDHDFALVLLDVHMPDMSGYEVAELMRGNKKTRNIPIIFVTAEVSNQQHIFKGYESGAVDYLFKPLEPVVFRSKVNVFLKIFRQKEALERNARELDRKLVELEELQQQLEETNEQLHMLSITDGLTGLYNKRQFNQLMADEWSRSMRHKSPFSVVLMDIDLFKEYNDTYGHAVGDECLRKVAAALTDVVKRGQDKVARVGGEEFAIILPDTDIEGAQLIGERVRSCIEDLCVIHQSSTVCEFVTASVGTCSTIPNMTNSSKDFMIRADQAMYQAKSAGRNASFNVQL